MLSELFRLRKQSALPNEEIVEAVTATSPAVLFYQKKLAENHQFLALRGMNTDFGVELPIDQIYVPLTTARGRIGERLESDRNRGLKGVDPESWQQPRDISLNDVFRESESGNYRGVILLGEPGAGKTTGARQLAWRLASGLSRPEELGLPSGIRPVFLRLRQLDPTVIDPLGTDSDQAFAIKSLQKFLNQETYCPGGLPQEQNPGPDLWNDASRGHGLLWILDGLDEVVHPNLRSVVSGWIRDLISERPNDRFFVTSRFQGYLNNHDVDLGGLLLEMHVKPLNEQQIEQFVTQWFEAADRRIEGTISHAAKKAAGDQTQLLEVLKTALHQSPSMLAMISNPLLLTIICIVFKRDNYLPTARAELYKQCLNVMLESSRADKFEKTRRRVENPFEVQAARTVLAKLAWWMHQEKDRSEVAITDLAQEATAALQRVSPESNLGIDGRAFIERVQAESGILVMSGEGNDKVGFLHLIFQEYLTAEYAARQGLAQQLAMQVSDSWWREVALLSLRCETSEEYVRKFFTQIVSDGILETNPDLGDRCIRETIYFPSEPFLEVLDRAKAQPAQVAAVLRVLRSRQKQVPQLGELCQRLVNSPDKEVRGIANEILVGLGVVGRTTVSTVAASTVTSVATSLGASTRPLEPFSLRVDEKTGQTLIWVPEGDFWMGSEKGYSDEKPVRAVRLTQGFYLGKYPVTNEQYGRYLAAQDGKPRVPEYWNDRRFNQPDQPVVGVSWDEAMAYCAWAGGRLPTEAEWEYACRAASTTAYCFGDDESQLGEYAWYEKNSGGRTQPVGHKKPNSWGFHDMHGNVWEWCQDWVGMYDPRTLVDPTGPSKGEVRSLRGGGWGYDAARCQSTFRGRTGPSIRGDGLGFRLALSPREPQTPSKQLKRN
ncbi:MAG: SUMF1/EgtB/PvdO family nonheme iron enzyme [Planctomycetota bacterium]